MGENEEKRSAWDGYRVRRNIFLFGCGLFFVLLLTLPFLESESMALFVVGSLGYLMMVPMSCWKCPACGRRFFSKAWAFGDDFANMFNPFRRKCASCGLPKWAEVPYAQTVSSHRKVPNVSQYHPVPDPKIARRKGQLTFLTLVLRDDPGAIGLKLDRDGWASVDDLLKRAKRSRIGLSMEDLDEIVSGDEKRHFEMGGFKTLIRFKRGAWPGCN